MSDTPDFLTRSDGNRLAYRRTVGSGPGVIFLSGFASDMSGTKALALEVWCRKQGRGFVRFDYLGHGESDGEFTDGAIGRWTEDAVAVIDKLTRGPQILVGSSMGGWLMLLAALARPERVAGLVGIAAAADFSEDLIWANFDTATRTRLEQEGSVLLPAEPGEEPYTVTRRFIEEARGHLLLRDTIPLHCPARLLHGMNDRDVPWQTSTRIAERLAGNDVRVILVRDAGHRFSRESDLELLTRTLAELSAQIGTV